MILTEFTSPYTCHRTFLLSLKLCCGLSGKLLCHRKLIMDRKLLWKEIMGLKWHWKSLLDFKFKFPWCAFGIRWWKIIWYYSHAIPSNTPTVGVTGSVFERERLWASNRLLSTIVYSLLTGGWTHCWIVWWTLLTTESKRISGRTFIQLGYIAACMLLCTWQCKLFISNLEFVVQCI